jgi:hypothetical protein
MMRVSVLALAFVAYATAAVVENRAVCNEDNVLRALEHNQPDSGNFCERYITQPAIITSSMTTPVTGTLTRQFYTQVTVTPIEYIIYQARDEFEKRTAAAVEKRTATPLPTYVSGYPVSRVSSACSCLLRFSATATVTKSVYTTTTTSTSIYTETATVNTYHAICAPSLDVLFQTLHNTRPATTISTLPSATGVIKAQYPIQCCELCATTPNCMYWYYKYFNRQNPKLGVSCKYVVGLEDVGNNSDIQIPDICPLGSDPHAYSALSGPAGDIGDDEDGYIPFNYTISAWHPGPCGRALNAFESNQNIYYPPQ